MLNSGAREMVQIGKAVVKVEQLSSRSLARLPAVKNFSDTIFCFLLHSHPILLQECSGPSVDMVILQYNSELIILNAIKKKQTDMGI